VVGKRDEVAGDIPTAFVVRRKDAQLDADSRSLERDIMDFVASKVSPQKKLRGGVIFIDEIPKSPSGKILRTILRDVLSQELVKQRYSTSSETFDLHTSRPANMLASKLWSQILSLFWYIIYNWLLFKLYFSI